MSVDVSVGHHHDLVVAHLLDVELFMDAGAERGDDRLHFGVGQHLVDPSLLDVEDLSADRQDRLDPRVTATLGRTTGGVTLDDEDLALGRVRRLAVGQLAGEATAAQQTLAVAGQVACLPGGDPGPSRSLSLANDVLALSRILLQPLAELFVDQALHEPLGLGVAELGLGLALELRVPELDRDDRRQTLADVVTGDTLFLLLDHPPLLAPVVDQRGERGAEALLVGPALVGVDRVRERVHRLGERGVPLHRDLEAHPGSDLLGLEVDDAQMRLVLAAVEVLDVVDQTAVVLEPALESATPAGVEVVRGVAVEIRRDGAVPNRLSYLLGLLALVTDQDLEALVEERHLPEPVGDGLEVIVRGLEDVLCL